MSTAADAAADAAALTVIHFVFYVLAGIGIGISVGVNLYVVIALEDLQSDLVNPHDATRRINRLVVWDIGSHAIGTAFMLLSGHWIVAAMNVPLIYYHAEGWKDKRLFMDVTEIFNRVAEERRARTRKLTFLGVVGFWTAYRVVYAALMTLLTEAGRKAMAKVLREASHSPMYHMF